MTTYRSLVIPVLCCLLVLVSCTKDEDKPIPQRDSVAVTPGPSPATGGEKVVPVPQEIPDTTAPPAPKHTPAPPKEKGDTYPEYFLGMEGKFGKGLPAEGEPATLQAVRTAQHEMFDRVVFEFDADRSPGYEVGYLDEPATACGSGNTVRVKGKAVLQLTLSHARAHTEAGQPTIKEKGTQLSAYPVLREIKQTCDFEGTVTYIIGVRSPNKIRVLELKDPARLILDIRNDKVLPEAFTKKNQ